MSRKPQCLVVTAPAKMKRPKDLGNSEKAGRAPDACRMVAPGQGRSNPNHVTPYLTHLVTHHGQLTLTPPQNAGRIRKDRKKNPERTRPDRRRDGDEPRFNTAVPSTPRGASRRGNNVSSRTARVPMPPPNMPRDSAIPDYPPPTFQEALMTAPFIPPPILGPPTEPPPPDSPSGGEIHDTSSSAPNDTRDLSRIAEASHPPPLTVQTAIEPSASPQLSPRSQQTADPQSGSSGSDEYSSNSSSLEIVTHPNATDSWDTDRQRGVPLDVRVHNELHRLRIAESTTNLASSVYDHPGTSTDLSLTNSCTHCGSPEPRAISQRQLPTQLSPDHTEDENDDLSPPSSPRSTKKGWKKLFAPIVTHDTKSNYESPLSPMPPKSPTTASKFTMLQNAWSSTVTLASTSGSPSKSVGTSSSSPAKRRESSGVRRLWPSKGKEREDEPGEENWEVVNRASILFEQEQAEKNPSSLSKTLASKRPGYDGTLKLNTPQNFQRPRISPSSPSTPGFLNRPVRHPAFSGSTLALPFNQSTASFAHSLASPSVSQSPVSDSGLQRKPKRPPPPPPPRRKAMSTTIQSTPSVIHLPHLDTDNVSTPLEMRQVSSPVTGTSNLVTTPTGPRPYPSLPSLRPSSREGLGEQLATLPNSAPGSRLPSPFAISSTPLNHILDPTSVELGTPRREPVPTIRYPSPMPHVVAPPAMTSEDSASALSFSMDSPPGTPTTPGHHYPGRPLPQVPHQPSPLRRAAVTIPLPEVGPAAEYSHVTELDVLAARALEGDHHDGRHYDDLLRIAEFSGPANTQDPFLLDADTLKIPTPGRVQVQRRRTMRDGRVKLKLTLMGSVVDKCGICLSQFKDTEVACLGTHCQHAFHEYCLKRWVVRSRTCPLCRADV